MTADDGSRRRKGPPSPRSAAWLEAFQAQYSEAVVLAVRRYAARLLQVPVDDPRAEQLAGDAVADTAAGHVQWDFASVALQAHLCGVVRSRIRHEWERAQQFPHHSLYDQGIQEEAEWALHLAAPDPRDADARAMIVELCQRVAHDPKLRAFIAALEVRDGRAPISTEVMQLTGFSMPEYRSLWRRLARIAKDLPVRRSRKAGG